PSLSFYVSSMLYIVLLLFLFQSTAPSEIYTLSLHDALPISIMLVGGASDTDTLFTSVNSIVGAEGALGGLLNNIEVFTIWDIIITALGLQVIAKFSKGLSWGIVLGIFVIMTGFTMLTS